MHACLLCCLPLFLQQPRDLPSHTLCLQSLFGERCRGWLARDSRSHEYSFDMDVKG